MTRIYFTESGILQQKKSRRTILITKDGAIEIERLPRKVTEKNAEEIAKAILNRQRGLEE